MMSYTSYQMQYISYFIPSWSPKVGGTFVRSFVHYRPTKSLVEWILLQRDTHLRGAL